MSQYPDYPAYANALPSAAGAELTTPKRRQSAVPEAVQKAARNAPASPREPSRRESAAHSNARRMMDVEKPVRGLLPPPPTTGLLQPPATSVQGVLQNLMLLASTAAATAAAGQKCGCKLCQRRGKVRAQVLRAAEHRTAEGSGEEELTADEAAQLLLRCITQELENYHRDALKDCLRNVHHAFTEEIKVTNFAGYDADAVEAALKLIVEKLDEMFHLLNDAQAHLLSRMTSAELQAQFEDAFTLIHGMNITRSCDEEMDKKFLAIDINTSKNLLYKIGALNEERLALLSYVRNIRTLAAAR